MPSMIGRNGSDDENRDAPGKDGGASSHDQGLHVKQSGGVVVGSRIIGKSAFQEASSRPRRWFGKRAWRPSGAATVAIRDIELKELAGDNKESADEIADAVAQSNSCASNINVSSLDDLDYTNNSIYLLNALRELGIEKMERQQEGSKSKNDRNASNSMRVRARHMRSRGFFECTNIYYRSKALLIFIVVAALSVSYFLGTRSMMSRSKMNGQWRYLQHLQKDKEKKLTILTGIWELLPKELAFMICILGAICHATISVVYTPVEQQFSSWLFPCRRRRGAFCQTKTALSGCTLGITSIALLLVAISPNLYSTKGLVTAPVDRGGCISSKMLAQTMPEFAKACPHIASTERFISLARTDVAAVLTDTAATEEQALAEISETSKSINKLREELTLVSCGPFTHL